MLFGSPMRVNTSMENTDDLLGAQEVCPQGPSAQLQWPMAFKRKVPCHLHLHQTDGRPQGKDQRGEKKAREKRVLSLAHQIMGSFLAYPKLSFHVMHCDLKEDIVTEQCQCS